MGTDPAAQAIAKPCASPELVAATIEAAGCGVCLILGAGVAGEPGLSAQALVEAVRSRFPETYRLVAATRTPDCQAVMAALSEGERSRLFADALAETRPGEAQRAVARLMAAGRVAVVLTTALDARLLAACVEAGATPAVYDAGAGLPAAPAEPAIVHLRGQRERVLDLAAAPIGAAYRARVEALMAGVFARGLPIVVVGYRGVGDPLAEVLAAAPRFANRLFWVGHGGHPLPAAARRLIAADNAAFAVIGHDAEGFLSGLADALAADAAPAADEEPTALVWPPRNQRGKRKAPVRSAAEPEPVAETAAAPAGAAEAGPAPLPARLRLVVGDYRRLIADYEAGRLSGAGAAEAAAWAHVMLGNRCILRARGRPWTEAGALWRDAVGHFRAALAIDPGHADALYNWGSALAAQARTTRGEGALRLWREAVDKLGAALAIAPEDLGALNDAARVHLALADAAAEAEDARREADAALALFERAAGLGDAAAYVAAIEVALAFDLEETRRRLRAGAPPPLPDDARHALALADLTHALKAGEDADMTVFEALPRRPAPPAASWDFGHAERAAKSLCDEDAAFVRAVIGLLHGERDRAAWPAVRDAWTTARTVSFQLARRVGIAGRA